MAMRLPIQAQVSPYRSKGVRIVEIHKRGGKIILCQFDGACEHSKRETAYKTLAAALKECREVWGVKADGWESI